MSSEKLHSIEDRHSPLRRAYRLLHMSHIYLELDPRAQETGLAEDIFRMVITEDMKFPYPENPQNARDERWKAEAVAANEKLDAIPTSIENRTTYSVQRGEEGQIHLIYHSERVDLGYKIPEVSVDDMPGETKEDRWKHVIERLANRIHCSLGRTPEEQAANEWNRAMQQTLLADSVQRIILDPEELAQGRLTIATQDNFSGLSYFAVINLNMPDSIDEKTFNFLQAVEFNLLGDIQRRGRTAPREIAQRITEVFNDAVGR